MTKAEFLMQLAFCTEAYCVTMPGFRVPMKLGAVQWWLETALDPYTYKPEQQDCYKPTVIFESRFYGMAVSIGMPMGHGIEVVP